MKNLVSMFPKIVVRDLLPNTVTHETLLLVGLPRLLARAGHLC